MDNITIYEFLQEKSTVPMGPDSYSDSGELTNSFRAKSNSEANEAVIKQIIERTITEIKNSKATSIGNFAFSACSSLINVDFPEATSIGSSAFNDCTALTNVNFPEVTSIGIYAFSACSSLINVDFPEATSIGGSAFNDCTALTNVNFPEAISIGDNAFNACTALTNVDFPEATSIGDNAFSYCLSLETLILRKNEVATLNSGAFTRTKIASGTGYIYVPDNLVDSYKAAQTWSAYAAQIKGLSELPDNS